jgi:uroporphyrinogen-III synthase
VLCVAGLREAIAATSAQVVQVSNLRPQIPETAEMDAADLLAAVRAHGARVDRFLHDLGPGLPIDLDRLRSLGADVVGAPVARPDGLAHDPERLARALRALL